MTFGKWIVGGIGLTIGVALAVLAGVVLTTMFGMTVGREREREQLYQSRLAAWSQRCDVYRTTADAHLTRLQLASQAQCERDMQTLLDWRQSWER
jgi:hypothetical protein